MSEAGGGKSRKRRDSSPWRRLLDEYKKGKGKKNLSGEIAHLESIRIFC